MRHIVTNLLWLASMVVGVAVGLWTAQFTSWPGSLSYACIGRCLSRAGFLEPTFALWECALMGVAAAAIVLLVSIAITRRLRAHHLAPTRTDG